MTLLGHLIGAKDKEGSTKEHFFYFFASEGKNLQRVWTKGRKKEIEKEKEKEKKAET